MIATFPSSLPIVNKKLVKIKNYGKDFSIIIINKTNTTCAEIILLIRQNEMQTSAKKIFTKTNKHKQ